MHFQSHSISTTLPKLLREAHENNQTLIIEDVNDLSPQLIPFLSQTSEQRLFFVTSFTDIYSVPESLLANVTALNVSETSLNSAHDVLVHIFVKAKNADLAQRIEEIDKTTLEHTMQVSRLEAETLSCLATMAEKRSNDEEYNYLEDSDLLAKLVDSKTRFFQAISDTEHNTDAKKEFDKEAHSLFSHIKASQIIWTCLSQHMCKIHPRYRFRFTVFAGVVESILTSNGNVIQELMDWAVSQLSLKDGLFFLFFVEFNIKSLDWDSLSRVVDRVRQTYDGPVKFGLSQALTTNPFEELQMADMSSFFETVLRFLRDNYGTDITERAASFFQANDVTSDSPTVPTIVYSASEQDPLPLIMRAMLKTRRDSLIQITLSSQTDERARKVITNAMPKNVWVILHYPSPSIEAARLLNEIPIMMATNPLNAGFRIIVNCHTVDYLSTQLMTSAKPMTLNSFPSPRLTIHRILKLDPAPTLPKGIKRFHYYASMIKALIGFRAFVEPFGFNMSNGVVDFDDVFAVFRQFLEDGADMKQIRNAREAMLELAVGYRVVETQDRRRVRALLTAMLPLNLMADDFTFVREGAEPFWSLNEQMATLIPTFPTTDGLIIDQGPVQQILQWNLSRWLAEPFLAISSNDPEEFTAEECTEKIAEVLSGIPARVTMDESAVSPLVLFWIREANDFNDLIGQIEEDLSLGIEEAVSAIMVDKAPVPWAEQGHIAGVHTLQRFLDWTKQRGDFLRSMLANVIPDTVALRNLSDPRGFFKAYHYEMALRQSVAPEALEIVFSIGQQTPLTLTDLRLFNAQLEGERLVSSPNAQAFTSLPRLGVAIVKKGAAKRGREYLLPMYRSPFMSGMMTEDEQQMEDGETENFVIEVPIPTDRSDRVWLLNGAAIFTRIPENFA